jgi:hypothetical protein
MHNPHAGVLRVLEMFSSDPIVHLGFVVGGDDESGPQKLVRKTSDGTDWLLAPYETRTISHMRIVGGVERNTTSLIHIRAELLPDDEFVRGEARQIVLLIPIEIVVRRRVANGCWSSKLEL